MEGGLHVDKVPMTAAGHQALESELKRLIAVERPHIIEFIAEARGHDDLSENAEYHAAKEDVLGDPTPEELGKGPRIHVWIFERFHDAGEIPMARLLLDRCLQMLLVLRSAVPR
jgi:hypothetical protein